MSQEKKGSGCCTFPLHLPEANLSWSVKSAALWGLVRPIWGLVWEGLAPPQSCWLGAGAGAGAGAGGCSGCC